MVDVLEGAHFYIEGFTTLNDTDNTTYYVKLVTPDDRAWCHFEWEIDANGVMETSLYEGASGGMGDGGW